MTQGKPTLGSAIDQIVQSLEKLDAPARLTALRAVCSHLNIDVGTARPEAEAHVTAAAPSVRTNAHPPPPIAAAAPVATTRIDIRSLKDSKKPKNAQQMACLVAYYLQEIASEGEKKDSVNASDLEKYFKQASFKLPQRVQQVLPDGKSSGYFDSAGRGEYKLNAVGYNLVAHSMPSLPAS